MEVLISPYVKETQILKTNNDLVMKLVDTENK